MVRALEQTKMSCHDVEAQVIAHGLSSKAAIVFFDALPTIDVLMPPLAMTAIEESCTARVPKEPRPVRLARRHRRRRHALASPGRAQALLRRIQSASGAVGDERAAPVRAFGKVRSTTVSNAGRRNQR